MLKTAGNILATSPQLNVLSTLNATVDICLHKGSRFTAGQIYRRTAGGSREYSPASIQSRTTGNADERELISTERPREFVPTGLTEPGLPRKPGA